MYKVPFLNDFFELSVMLVREDTELWRKAQRLPYAKSRGLHLSRCAQAPS